MPQAIKTSNFGASSMSALSPTIRQRNQNYEAKQLAQLVSLILRRRLRAMV